MDHTQDVPYITPSNANVLTTKCINHTQPITYVTPLNTDMQRYQWHICVILHSQKELYKMWSRSHAIHIVSKSFTAKNYKIHVVGDGEEPTSDPGWTGECGWNFHSAFSLRYIPAKRWAGSAALLSQLLTPYNEFTKQGFSYNFQATFVAGKITPEQAGSK